MFYKNAMKSFKGVFCHQKTEAEKGDRELSAEVHILYCTIALQFGKFYEVRKFLNFPKLS